MNRLQINNHHGGDTTDQTIDKIMIILMDEEPIDNKDLRDILMALCIAIRS